MDRGCRQKLLWKTFVNAFGLAHVISANIKGEELGGVSGPRCSHPPGGTQVSSPSLVRGAAHLFGANPVSSSLSEPSTSVRLRKEPNILYILFLSLFSPRITLK